MDLSDENHGGKRLVSLSDSDSDESAAVPIVANSESSDHPNPVPLRSVEKQAEEESNQSPKIADPKIGDGSSGGEERNKEIEKFGLAFCFQSRGSLENPQISVDALNARTQELMRSVGVCHVGRGFL